MKIRNIRDWYWDRIGHIGLAVAVVGILIYFVSTPN